ncbi:hypothetical protein B0J13DRAFT_622441 [Dactylonectria estremocensis]|uniref:Tafazzin n=1 Tax=Dactylonectria estremocensis TaxID=1079267 RepID=A0A9P9EW60_9HYPO|nr:hypothetical protein B0J13DRAFT_622441 [Dactylonectria estremocensis]
MPRGAFGPQEDREKRTGESIGQEEARGDMLGWRHEMTKLIGVGDKPQKSVNDLLANLRRTSIGPSNAAQSAHPATAPSVPPAIRELLQIPETPAPRPRRPVRQRFDENGRRLPAGPPPPRSWLSHTLTDGSGSNLSSAASQLNLCLADTSLPGTYLPAPGSLIAIVLQKLAYGWSFHRVYNQYHLYFVPNHLKAALIRFVGIASEEGLSLSDLKTILLPPPDTFEEDELEGLALSNHEVNYLDLSGSIGRNLKLKDVGNLLFPTTDESSVEPQESWDSPESVLSPPRSLLPNLTHLSLAIDPMNVSSAPWKQLIALSTKLTSLTHLSLAHWPEPSLMTVTSPDDKIPLGMANLYSHSIDHDWSEALLVLRLLSRNLYALEYLDLTGCTPWFQALMAESEHDHVDWVTNWGKITNLRLCTGLKLENIPHQIGRELHNEAGAIAKNVERHIRAARAGKGRFVVVESDE